MARHQPAGRLCTALLNIEAAPHRYHEGQQQQGNSDAQHREDAAAFVAEGVLGDKSGQSHIRNPVELQGRHSVLDCGPAESRQASRINERVRIPQLASDSTTSTSGTETTCIPTSNRAATPKLVEKRHPATMTMVTLLSVN